MVSALDSSRTQEFGSSLDGITTAPIPGKSLKIGFRSSNDSSASASGCAAIKKLPMFTLTCVGYESAKTKQVTKEEICGASELKNVKCLTTMRHNSAAILNNKDKAMMRLLTQRDNLLKTYTAWLWDSKGHIVTNYHCISTQAHVDKTKFQFQIEMPGCEDKWCEPLSYPVDETLLSAGNVKCLKTDATLDYAVMQITTNLDKFTNKYGYLKVHDGEPKYNEAFFLVQ